MFEAFVGWCSDQGLDLYPAQTEALIEIVSGSHVILSTPTGSGKSLVAAGAHFAALAAGRRTYYTAPIKALVSEKFFALVAMFGADRVGMVTGDARVNADAPIICCTAEILANLALRDGNAADVSQVVMDEFHFYADPDRGWAWQVPLLELTDVQFLLMSATLGDVSRFEADLVRRTGRDVAVVATGERPVPLYHDYVATPLLETITDLLDTRQAPIYVVHFSQAAALERAQALMSINVCTREEKDAIADLIGGFRFTAGFGRTLSRLVRHGIGVHHAGMLPKYRRLVEVLAQAGLLKIICGTDTLGVGINVPIRTVVFTALSKYDGTKSRLLSAREFHQIAGRAGRAGYDPVGNVIVQAPDHVIENERTLAKIGDDPKKRRKLRLKKPPEGTIGYGKATFDRLVAAEPEPLTSSFAVSHAMLLNVIARPGDCYVAMRHLLTRERRATRAAAPPRTPRDRRLPCAARRRAWSSRSIRLMTKAGPRGSRLTSRPTSRLTSRSPRSRWPRSSLLDPASETYALDVTSVIESTLENPRPVLSAQRFKARGEAVSAMKAEGIEYEERMELLESIGHPEPLVELLDAAYETYRQGHPWVADYELKPKSIARDLYERSMTFVEYVGFYQLARSEGLVLRYLADAYKALRQTVPEDARSEELGDIIVWLGELVRQVDSSLLDEWEELLNPSEPDRRPTTRALDERPPPVTSNERAFRVLVRNAMFRRVELVARRRFTELGELDGESGWDFEMWADAVAPYFEQHGMLNTGADARGPQLLIIDQQPDKWVVRQIFDDPAGNHDWGISAEVDLAASDDAGVAMVTVIAVDEL